MKTLKQLLELKASKYNPTSDTLAIKSDGEKAFYDKHNYDPENPQNSLNPAYNVDGKDRAGNGDDVYRATNIKPHDRSPRLGSPGHGYNKGEDVKVNESKTLTQILEKHLTTAETSKQVAEEVDLFQVFTEDIREQVRLVYESLDEENKQIIIEMVEAEDYDTIVNVVKEVVNG